RIYVKIITQRDAFDDDRAVFSRICLGSDGVVVEELGSPHDMTRGRIEAADAGAERYRNRDAEPERDCSMEEFRSCPSALAHDTLSGPLRATFAPFRAPAARDPPRERWEARASRQPARPRTDLSTGSNNLRCSAHGRKQWPAGEMGAEIIDHELPDG